MKNRDKASKGERLSFWIWTRDILFHFVSLATVLTGFSEILTWCLGLIWGISTRDLCQSIWNNIIIKLGDDGFTLYVTYTFILIMVVYWAFVSLFTVMDLFKWPKWSQKYKVQPLTNEEFDLKALLSVVRRVLFNQIFCNIPVLTAAYFIFKSRGFPDIATLPTLNSVMVEFFVFLLIEDMGFYYIHRLFHHPRLYKRIHKWHHEWTSPMAIGAFDSHPLDHTVSNVIPVALGPIILSSHISVVWLYTSLAIVFAIFDHCGYHLPWMPSSEFHDFHHHQFTECYGTQLGIFDYLHGTDRTFRSNGYQERHHTSYSLAPVSSRFPVIHSTKDHSKDE